MAKRISRRELKERIKNLQYALNAEHYNRQVEEDKRKEIEKRFMELGSKAENYDLKGQGLECIEIRPEPWGQFVRLAGDKVPEEITDEIKQRLCSAIARGLMESNRVQILVKDDDFFGGKTIGAKLWVVPWEKTVSRIVIKP